jgi:hypothetical protein
VAVADFNGDGFPDLAVVDNTVSAVTVLLNQTTQFGAPVPYAAGSQPDGVAVGDFNGDGRQDFAAANKASNSVSVYLGKGDGTFLGPFNYATDVAPTQVIAADFNNDGKLDLAVACSGGNDVSVLLGNGDGTFRTAINSRADASPVSLTAADFNHDGFLDLGVVNVLSNSLDVLINNGNGTFRTLAAYSTGLSPQSVASGDFNGDGIPDLVVANFGTGVVSDLNVYLGNGDGTFQAPSTLVADTGTAAVVVTDLNRDGKQDLVVANSTSNDVSVLLGNGNGTFQGATNYGVGGQPESVSVGDFNHDGKRDLVAANFASDTVSLLLGNGDGTFQAAVNYDAGANPAAVASGAFNGAPDLVVADAGSANVSVLLNQQPSLMAAGAGVGAGPEVTVFNSQSGAVVRNFAAYAAGFHGGVRVAMGDVDGDGDEDIVTAPGISGGPDVRVFDGSTGQLIRDFMAYSPTFLGGVNVAVADVNGDGYADIITGADAGGGPHVKVFSGKDGSVLYSFMAYSVNFLGGVRVAGGDVNGDGKADIVTAPGPSGGPDIRVFDGNSGQLFQEFLAYDASFTFGVYVAAGDVNGDGHADIIAGTGEGSSATANVKVFSGLNDSLLSSFFPYPNGFQGGARVGAVQDVNGDGLVDIVTGAGPGGGPQVTVFDGSTLQVLDSLFAYSPSFPGGVFVGGSA